MLLGCADEKCKYWYRLSGFWKVFVSRMFVKGNSEPLKTVRSRQLIDVVDCSCVNRKFRWKELR